jgi:CDP-diacylglycerol--glycerol-3-phosphate 3-phosphatidyltransferase
MEFIYKNENILNLPNAISLYRLLTFPLILVLALVGNEYWFVILISINLVTDILDGFIARRFNLTTRFGAALDNLADIGTYILALTGLFIFKWLEIQPYAWLLYLFFFVFALSYLVAFLRFRKIPGLHIYSAVIAGYLQGVFFFVLFVFGFHLWFYYIAVGWGVIAYIEKIIILLIVDDIRPGLKGLVWIRRN